MITLLAFSDLILFFAGIAISLLIYAIYNTVKYLKIRRDKSDKNRSTGTRDYVKAKKSNIDSKKSIKITEENKKSIRDTFLEEIGIAKKNLKAGDLVSRTLIIAENLEEKKIVKYYIPMNIECDQDKQMLGYVIKQVVKNVLEDDKLNILSVVSIINAHMNITKSSMKNIDDFLNSSEYIRPSEDKNAKDALVCVLEDRTGKTLEIYEYVSIEDGGINHAIISDKPMVQEEDTEIGEFSKFGNFFPKDLLENK